MAVDIREKIQKLLALSESSNEHEAYAALMKARELIAKNKLDERDFEKKEEKQVIKTMSIQGLSFSMRRDPWVQYLAQVVSENYCCKTFFEMKKRTRYVNFSGLSEDVDICTDVFRYALECARSGIEKEKRKYFKSSIKEKTLISDSYGCGFVKGLNEAFIKQNQENERDWGLILKCPKEVSDFIDNITETVNTKCKKDVDESIFNNGYAEGKQFTTRKQLGEENVKIERS